MKWMIMLAAAALASACAEKKQAAAEPANAEPQAALAEPMTEPVAETVSDPVAESPALMAGCPVIDSRDWSAWIDRMPKVDNPGPRLHVAGEIDLPTPGYAVAITEGPMDRAMPPGLRLILTATPPDGMTAEVITATPVKYEGPAAFDTYRAIYIVCEGEGIAEITTIDTVE